MEFKEITDNMEKYALEYCEGNDELYSILIELWKQGFITIGCCKGHDDRNAYIGFSLYSPKEKIIKLLSSLSKKNINITFVNEGEKKGFSIAQNYSNNIFSNILASLNDDKIDNYFEKLYQYMMTYNGEYLNVRLHYTDYNLKVYINTMNKNLIKKLKKQYEYKVLNEKINLYHFKINL